MNGCHVIIDPCGDELTASCSCGWFAYFPGGVSALVLAVALLEHQEDMTRPEPASPPRLVLVPGGAA